MLNFWGIMVLVGVILALLGAMILALSSNSSARSIAWIFLVFGLIIFVIGILGSYYLLKATTKTIAGDKAYRKRELESTEGDASAVGQRITLANASA